MTTATKFATKMTEIIPLPQKVGMNPASFGAVGDEIKQLVSMLTEYEVCISDLLIAYTWAKANGKRVAKAIRAHTQRETDANDFDNKLIIMMRKKRILHKGSTSKTNSKAIFVMKQLLSLEEQFNYTFSILSNAQTAEYKEKAIQQLNCLIQITLSVGSQLMGLPLIRTEATTVITATEWEIGYQLHLNKHKAYLDRRSPFFKQLCIALLALVKRVEPKDSNAATARARSFLPNIKDWFDMRELMHQYLFLAPIDQGHATSKPIQKKITTTPAPTNETSEEFVELQFNVRITQSGKVNIDKRLAAHSLPATAVSKISTDVIQLLWKINHEIVSTAENSPIPAILTQIQAELTRDKEQVLIDAELGTFLNSKNPSTVQLSEITLRFMQEALSKHTKS